MKKTLFILVVTALQAGVSEGQTVESILGMTTDFMFVPVSQKSRPLFEASEIKERKIRYCTITESSYNRSSSSWETDTVYVFDFDTNGNIKTRIRFWNYSRNDTFDYTFNQSLNHRRMDSSVTFKDGGRIIEKYHIWAYNWEKPDEEDTGIVVRTVYDHKNRLVELKSNGTTDYHSIIFCGTGITYHYKYRYDEENNLVYFDDVQHHYYAEYHHKPGGISTSVYNKRTGERVRKYFVRIKKGHAEILEHVNGVKATLKFMDPESRLFAGLSVQQKEYGPIPTIYKFIYRYETVPEAGITDHTIVSN